MKKVVGVVLLVAYFLYVGSFFVFGALISEAQAVARCNSLCKEQFGVMSWQTVENSDACERGIYFCECGGDYADAPTEQNVKINIANGQVLSTDVAYELFNLRDEESCW